MARKTFRKIITSPELIEQINPESKKLMERFLKNYSTKKSPNTIVNYRSNLNIFFCWLVREDNNVPYVELKKMDFMDFFDYASLELHWGSQRFSNCHACLSSFSKWIERMYDEKYPNFRNLLPYIEKPVKEMARKKSVFTQEETSALMNWLGNEGYIQEQCLLALMLSSGARLSELVRFRTDLIDENNLAYDDLFLETTDEIQIKGRGVNGKHELRCILKDTFIPYYHKWLIEREKIVMKNNQDHTYIFIRKDGTPATKTTIKGWMEKWDKYTRENFSKDFYPHSMRHNLVSRLLSVGLEKELVQSIFSWTTADMVSVYSDLKASDRKWKGLDKLKTALEQDKVNQENENKLEKENKENENQKENT